MGVASLSPRELEPQLAHILERYHEDMTEFPRPVAFHTDARWQGPSDLTMKGQAFQVVEARTVLELRERLASSSGDRLPVILTPLEEGALPQDSRARLLRFRLFPVDAWEAVKSLFRASALDPRLRARELAEALLQNAPPDGYPPVPTGVLDADSAWRALYRTALGMGARVPEGRDLLRWAGSLEAQLRYVQAPEPFRKVVRSHFESRLGRVARVIFQVLDAGKAGDLPEFALVCDLLERAYPQAPQAAELVAARAEYLVGSEPLSRGDVSALAQAVRDQLQETGGEELDKARLNPFDSMLHSLRATGLAHMSPFSPLGLEERLVRLGEALVSSSLSGSERWERLKSVAEHRLLAGQQLFLERCTMLTRLAGWLREGGWRLPAEHDSVLSLSRAYLRELAWVDRARERLAAADLGVLQARSREVLEEVAQRRGAFNRAFGLRLAEELGTGTWSEELLLIEQALDKVVAAQAKIAPVLMIVLDGMSWPVALVLAEDLALSGWELVWEGASSPPVVLATVPTVTEFSRMSLLAGQARAGQAALERKAFGAASSLLAVSRPTAPPRVFHKEELSEDGRGGLSALVRDAVSTPSQQVVAVVVNAIDDRLKGPQQTDSSWELDAITPLRSLLEAAQEAGRRVILTADHGHVWEAGSHKLPGGSSERWREPGSGPGTEEVKVGGPRVTAVTGMREVVVPWSENVRYTLPKAGYHGGVTPQEVLVPMLLAVPQGGAGGSLQPLELSAPAWWEALPVRPVTGEEVVPPPVETRPRKAPRGVQSSPVLPLFPSLEPARAREGGESKVGEHREGTENRPTENRTTEHRLTENRLTENRSPGEARGSGTGLVDRLLGSAVFKSQADQVGRPVPEATVRALLGPLVDQGGRLSVRLAAASLKVQEYRVAGVVAQVGRLLNVDGYPILTLDREENLVRLDLAQLRVQFELKGA